MTSVAQVLIALIALLHACFVLLETVLFKTRGGRVVGLSSEQAEIMAPAMSKQGCYNGFWWRRWCAASCARILRWRVRSLGCKTGVRPKFCKFCKAHLGQMRFWPPWTS